MLFTAFLFSIFIEYVRPGNYIPVIEALKVGTIIPLLVFTVCISRKEPVSNTRILQHVNTKQIFILLALLLLSVMTAKVTFGAFEIFKDVVGYLFWYVMIVKLGSDLSRIKMIFAVYVFCHLFVLILNPAVVMNPETRTYVTAAPFLGDGNDFALSVSLVFPMCLYLYMEAKTRFAKLSWLGCSLVLLFSVIGTQSRGAAIATACVFLFLWWNSKKKFSGLLLICSILVIVANYAPDVYFDRLSTIAHYEEEGSAMGRIMAWKAAMRMAADNPVLGVGAGYFAIALGTEYKPPEFGDVNMPWLTAHSLYFLVLGELGFPGLILILSMIIGNNRRVRRLFKAADDSTDGRLLSYSRLFLMLNASLIAFAVGGAFLSVAYYPHLYILLGLIVASTYVYESEIENNANQPSDGSSK